MFATVSKGLHDFTLNHCEVLENYKDLPSSEIYSMVRQAPIANTSEIMERIPGLPTDRASYLSTVRSNIYTLISDAQLTNSEAVNRVRCVVRIDGRSRTGHSVLYWNEANIEM